MNVWRLVCEFVLVLPLAFGLLLGIDRFAAAIDRGGHTPIAGLFVFACSVALVSALWTWSRTST